MYLGQLGVGSFESDYASSNASSPASLRACTAALWAAMVKGDAQPDACDFSPAAVDEVDRHLLVNPEALQQPPIGAELVVMRAERLGRPLLSELTDYDVNWGNSYPNVAYDTMAAPTTAAPTSAAPTSAAPTTVPGLYKMWWSGLSACPQDYAKLEPGCTPTPPFEQCVCPHPGYAWPEWQPKQNVTTEWSLTYYAESVDGLSWDRPAVGQHPLPYSRSSNDVVTWAPGADMNRGVLFDELARNGSERYKMIGSFANPSAGPPSAPVQTGLFATSQSADGVHWDAPRPFSSEWQGFHGPPGRRVQLKRDSHHNMYFDVSRGRYYAYVRTVAPPECRADPGCAWHRIGVASSADFRNWTVPAEILKGTHEGDNMTYAFVGWRQDDTHLAVAMIYNNVTGVVRCELAASASPDEGWLLVQPGAPLIPSGPAGSFDEHICFAAAHPLWAPSSSAAAAAHRIYYAAADGRHSSVRHNSISMATLRPHRFAGWRAAKGAVLVTRPVVVSADTLVLTVDVDAASAGSVRVGVRLGNATVPGLSRGECLPFTANETDATVAWGATSTVSMDDEMLGTGSPGALSRLVGMRVELVIELEAASAFAFGFRSSRWPVDV